MTAERSTYPLVMWYRRSARIGRMHLVVLAGGIGGGRFLRGVREYARTLDAHVTAIVNVGDDISLHGLRVCPDLDS